MFNKEAFNRGRFESAFAQTLDALGQAESITRRELRDVSRSILTAIHCTEDSAFLNRLIDVLTPQNKKVMVEYLKHFSGFHYDDKLMMFTKKNKPTYAKAAQLSEDFLSEPHNNVWTWAERNLKTEKVEEPYDVTVITNYMKKAMDKAVSHGFSQKDVFKAVLASGISVDAMIDMLDELGYAEVVEPTDVVSPVDQPAPF